MLKTFGDLTKNVKLKAKLAVIDNNVFHLHYRFTFLILLAASVLVSSRQYIGEHIRCIADTSIKIHVIETYCFFTTTFTVVRHLNETAVAALGVPHPGVGPYDLGEAIIVHAYYQWVPFVLFGQALMFYLPHFIWKHLEGGRILALVTGFENSALALREASVKLAKTQLPSRRQYEEKVRQVQKAFLDHLHLNRFWGAGLVTCELLNAANLLFQFFFNDLFLGGGFSDLGMRATVSAGNEVDPLDIVFPKMTKCTFRKYGASGTIQTHDALCVMALNIVNEKIYIFLWFWFVVLGLATMLGLAWRVATLLLHSRSEGFNKWVFRSILDKHSLKVITSRCNFSDWLLLYYIGKSMHSCVFRELVDGLAFDMEEVKLTTGPDHGDEKLLAKEN